MGRASDSLSAADMDRLVPPLIEAWKSQLWDCSMDGESTDDSQLTICQFSIALANVATYGRSLYAPYAEGVFAKACTDIEGDCKSYLSDSLCSDLF